MNTNFIFLFLLFFCVLLFPDQSIAQSNDPLCPVRDNYNIHPVDRSGFFTERSMDMLRAEEYPWGVCHFYYDEFSQNERAWTRGAMEMWNNEFAKYRLETFGTHDVVNIPTGKLFVESCDDDNYNIIYTRKDDLENPTVAYYSARDLLLDFMTFYGIIGFSKDETWNKAFFTNVMVHELGHVLGIPHAKFGDSTFMAVHGFDCKEPKKNICEFQKRYDGTIYEIEAFIEPFPGEPMTRARAERERIKAWDEFYRKHYESCGLGGTSCL